MKSRFDSFYSFVVVGILLAAGISGFFGTPFAAHGQATTERIVTGKTNNTTKTLSQAFISNGVIYCNGIVVTGAVATINGATISSSGTLSALASTRFMSADKQCANVYSNLVVMTNITTTGSAYISGQVVAQSSTEAGTEWCAQLIEVTQSGATTNVLTSVGSRTETGSNLEGTLNLGPVTVAGSTNLYILQAASSAVAGTTKFRASYTGTTLALYRTNCTFVTILNVP